MNPFAIFTDPEVFEYWHYHPVMQIFIFVVGACIGSFLNVCIYRIPLNRPVTHPGSHCATCGAPIPWYNNIPIFSWWILRGRAACCGTRIEWRYWLIEGLSAFMFLALWRQYPNPLVFLCYALFLSGLLASSAIDIDTFTIPDRFTWGGVAAGVVCSALVPQLQNKQTWSEALFNSAISAVIAWVTLMIIKVLGTWIFKKDAMGYGDVKFLAAMAAFLGGLSVAFIIPMSSLVGSVFGLVVIMGRQGTWGTRIPYGPFLAIAAAIYIFGGQAWMKDYISNVMEQAKQVMSTPEPLPGEDQVQIKRAGDPPAPPIPPPPSQ